MYAVCILNYWKGWCSIAKLVYRIVISGDLGRIPFPTSSREFRGLVATISMVFHGTLSLLWILFIAFQSHDTEVKNSQNQSPQWKWRLGLKNMEPYEIGTPVFYKKSCQQVSGQFLWTSGTSNIETGIFTHQYLSAILLLEFYHFPKTWMLFSEVHLTFRYRGNNLWTQHL